MFDPRDVFAYFNARARQLACEYNAIDRRSVHRSLLQVLRADGIIDAEDRVSAARGPVRLLDIGAGSGADAAMFAGMGFFVTAAEPAADLRAEGEAAFSHLPIVWSNDTLPALETICRAHIDADSVGYHVICLSAVVQYLDDATRGKALSTVFALTAPGGYVDILYPTPPSREFQHKVDPQNLRNAVNAFNKTAADGDGFDIVVDDVMRDVSGRKALNGEDLYFVTMVLRRRGGVCS